MSYSIAVQSDGKVLAGGDFADATNGGPGRATASPDSNATACLTERSTSRPSANFFFATAIQPDGKIICRRCCFPASSAQPRNNIARLNADGTLDTAFNPNSNSTIFSIALQPDGKIVAGGFFTMIGGQPRTGIARLDPVTGLADSFNPNANGNVHAVVLQSDGKILAGGDFTAIGGQTRNRIARLDAATGLGRFF